MGGTQLATAEAQVQAEQSVLDAVNAAKQEIASVSNADVSEAAAQAAQSEASSVDQSAIEDATQVAQAAAQTVSEEVRAAQNVNQLIQYADGSIHHLVGKTGVNVSAGQTVIWSGLTSESHSAYGSEGKARAIEEASKATGIAVDDIYNPEN